MDLVRILAISGSLRAMSSNSALLRTAAAVAPPGVEITQYEGLARLPHFNPDDDLGDPPEPVLELRAQVGAADALLFCVPEYAHGMPGSLKNALDWLVSSIELPGKHVALLNASPMATHAQAALRETLTDDRRDRARRIRDDPRDPRRRRRERHARRRRDSKCSTEGGGGPGASGEEVRRCESVTKSPSRRSPSLRLRPDPHQLMVHRHVQHRAIVAEGAVGGEVAGEDAAEVFALG